jgi:hypothetical protein
MKSRGVERAADVDNVDPPSVPFGAGAKASREQENEEE